MIGQWRVLAVPLALLAAGCGKRVSGLVADHQADYAALDARIAQANALVAKVPERGVRSFPRCKPTDRYLFSSSGGPHDTDVIGGSALAGYPSPIADVLKMRKDAEGKGRFSGPKASAFDEKRFELVKGVKNLVVLREHKDSTEHHVSADVFVVSGEPAKITCAFGFDGGEGGYGSVGTVTGKEVWTDKRTGRVVRERDHVEGASSGTSGAAEARNRLPSALARNLGLDYSYSTKEEAAKYRAGYKRPLGEFPTIRVKEVLEDRGASNLRNFSAWNTPFGTNDGWNTDGIHLEIFDLGRVPGAVLGKEQVVNVGPQPDDVAFATKLAAEPVASAKDLVARVKGAGYVLFGAEPPDLPAPYGFRKYELSASKGGAQRKISVLDFGPAARKQGDATVRIDGRRLIVVQGKSSVLGPAEEIANEIMAAR